MRVFVTGASGHIGSALLPDLVSAGHEVVGLARSDSAAAAVESYGATVLRGELTDLDALQKGASESDGVIHLAYNHAAMQAGDMGSAAEQDLAALEAMGQVLAGTDKPFVGTGGTLMLAHGGIVDREGTEEDHLPEGVRVDAENLVISWAEQGVRSSVVRLSPITHSDLDHHGFAPTLIQQSRDFGYAAYLGEGTNHWPAVHTRDAARLYRLALEKAEPGSRLHGVAESGIQFKEIATTIGRNLDLPVRSVTPEQAAERFGFLAWFVGFDNRVSNTITKTSLGWEPEHPGLIADLDQGHYFSPAAN